MKRLLGIVLGIAALFAGGLLLGWKGVVIVMAVLIVIMLMQFWKLMRLMGMASKGPVGRVASASGVEARLRAGMKMTDVLPLTGSLGEKLADTPPTYGWTDAQGERIELVLEDGKLGSWRLVRTP